ncbi:MAG: hypothetical protein ACRBCI_04865 [Cellvibrionaceae bacterium]
MKFVYRSLFIIFLSFIIVACSTGPVEELEDPQDPKGPGLFSGPKGEFSYSSYFDKKKKAKEGRKVQRRDSSGSAIYYDVDLPAIDEQGFKDFEQFKAWRRAQEPGSVDYQEYQDWRAYQQYRRFKAQEAESIEKTK